MSAVLHGFRPAGIVFDLDGTLIDSERAIVAAGSAAFAELGVAVSELEVADHLGAPLEELYDLFVGDGDAPRRARFIERYIALHDDHPERKAAALPGVVDALLWLKERGVPCGIATTKPTHRAHEGLEGAGLSSFFARRGSVQGTDPPLLPKPHPDVVLAACRGIGVDAARCIMVGDTPRDVGAARAAGCKSAVVAYSDKRLQAALEFGADVVVRRLSELFGDARG